VRLLVVEDDVALARVVARGLVEEGHAVDAAATAAGADQLLFENDYDLVILDIGLPDGDGLDLCRSLRDGHSAVRILALTARDALEDRVRGLDAGGTGARIAAPSRGRPDTNPGGGLGAPRPRRPACPQ